MKKIQLTIFQKKIITSAVIILLVFLICFLAIYLPMEKKVKALRLQISLNEGQIREIESMIDKAKTNTEVVEALKEKYQRLQDRFPQRKEEALRELSEIAKKLNIEVVSVNPQPKAIFYNEDNKPVNIEGRDCQVLAVFFEMRCFYKDIVKYIEMLNESAIVFVTVETLKLNKYSDVGGKLAVALGLKLYILS